MRVQAIVFDLDDTLIADEASADAAFMATCRLARLKYGIDPDDLRKTVRATSREIWYASPAREYCVTIGMSSWEGLSAQLNADDPGAQALREWLPTYWREAWTRALARHGVNDEPLAQQLSAAFQKERRARYIVYPDVRSVLEQLRKSFRLAVLTNGPTDLQRYKLQAADMESCFDAVTISGEIGIGKPDRRIFELVLSRLGVRAEAAVMVGDSARSDVAGAQGVGMRAIWINRAGKERDKEIMPDAEITSLSELAGVLKVKPLEGC